MPMPKPRISAAQKPWFDIRNVAGKDKEADEAEILIYDYIGWGGVTALDFVAAVKALKVPRITVALNTPGGDVFDGLAIYNVLKAHEAEVHVRIDALAASIGSIIALAGDQIDMAESAYMMIHNPWGMVIGNANDMREMAGTLDKVGGSLEKIYQDRTGLSPKAVRAVMDAETWYTAEEAKAIGLVDSVTNKKKEEGEEDEEMSAAFDLATLGYKPPSAYLARLKEIQGGADCSHMTKRIEAMQHRRVALAQRGERSR